MAEFHRKYVLLAVLVGVAFVVGAYFVGEAGREQRIAGMAALQRVQVRNRLLADLQSAVTDAESAQRGFLLTGNEEYLTPYRQSRQTAETLLVSLADAYSVDEAPMRRKALELSSVIATKFAEIDATLALHERSRAEAMALVRTDFGQRVMEEVRVLTKAIRDDDNERIQARTAEWLRSQEVARIISTTSAVLNIVLILAAGLLVERDLRRRSALAADLSSQVIKATGELSELSTYLQQVSEREKSTLARELHDELGGLLIAMKMDLAQFKSYVDLKNPAVNERWERIQATLSAGIDLKRRVIEQLRPSLLDNMGLIAAVQWQAAEICSRANLKLIEHYPDTVPELNADASIAIFRVAQESLTNIVKHARATTVELTLTSEHDRLTLCIDDDGVGVPEDRMNGIRRSHGIAGMRNRLAAYQGGFRIEARQPRGTRVLANLPYNLIVKREA